MQYGIMNLLSKKRRAICMELNFKNMVEKVKNIIPSKKTGEENAETGLSDVEIAVDNTSADCDYSERNVLVGVVRNTYQFDVMMHENFYHIPVSKTVDCQFPVKYIAVYQSKKYFGKGAGIRYFGEVESCTTVPRSKIREIPKDSKENYLYFKIKSWQLLSKTVEAKEMDNVAFSTTMYMLKSCHDSAELQLRSREEHKFYIKLLSTVKRLVRDRQPDGEDIVYKDFTVKLQGGVLHLYFADVLEYAIGYDIFIDNPMDVIRDIFDYYPEVE